jgi:dGTP triphosphohydrolase
MGSNLHPVSDRYSALLWVTDFVSVMTDRYAVEPYRTLKGISV